MSGKEYNKGLQAKDSKIKKKKKNMGYVEISDKERQIQIDTMLDFINSFLTENNYNYNDINSNECTIYQIINKVYQRKQYFKIFHNIDMSDLKELALNCFWIVKLKPLCLNKNLDEKIKVELRSINEKFAVYYIIKVLRVLIINTFPQKQEQDEAQKKLNDFFDELYIYELVYCLFYRDISKEAFIMLVETIAKGIGLQPYDKNSLSCSN